MQIKDYLEELIDVIASSPYVVSKTLLFEERPPNAAFINGMINFIDGSKLHFKEFIIYKSEKIIFLKYAYNYLSKDDKLIFRYDNALDPKAKTLETYPEHKHVRENNIVSARRPSINEVIREISELIGRQ